MFSIALRVTLDDLAPARSTDLRRELAFPGERGKVGCRWFCKDSGSAAPFVSRGDKSGTHTKELELWQRAGIDPKGKKWYLEVGQGMEKTQRIANEKRAYALTDRGTWLATKDADKLDMVILFEKDPLLFNQYGVMAVNPEKHKHVKYKDAMEFVNWIISKEGQQAIASFKDALGNQLFYPNAK